MIRPGKIAEFENVRSAIECRYLFEAILDDELLKATQRQLKASLFEFVTDNKTQTKERFVITAYLFLSPSLSLFLEINVSFFVPLCF